MLAGLVPAALMLSVGTPSTGGLCRQRLVRYLIGRGIECRAERQAKLFTGLILDQKIALAGWSPLDGELKAHLRTALR